MGLSGSSRGVEFILNVAFSATDPIPVWRTLDHLRGLSQIQVGVHELLGDTGDVLCGGLIKGALEEGFHWTGLGDASKTQRRMNHRNSGISCPDSFKSFKRTAERLDGRAIAALYGVKESHGKMRCE
jgi:hypothetical protein